MPGATKWFYSVWRREHTKKLDIMYVRNLLEAVDSAADNMRVWYTHVLFASLLAALFVSPRATAVIVAIFCVSRLFTWAGMLLDNPVPQTLLQSGFTILMFRGMIGSWLNVITFDLFPEWFHMAMYPLINKEVFLSI